MRVVVAGQHGVGLRRVRRHLLERDRGREGNVVAEHRLDVLVAAHDPVAELRAVEDRLLRAGPAQGFGRIDLERTLERVERRRAGRDGTAVRSRAVERAGVRRRSGPVRYLVRHRRPPHGRSCSPFRPGLLQQQAGRQLARSAAPDERTGWSRVKTLLNQGRRPAMSTAVGAGTYLHHIQLQSHDPARLARFYADALDMTARQLGGDWICEGPLRRVLFTPGEDKALGFGAFACRDAEGLAAVRRARRAGRRRRSCPPRARSSGRRPSRCAIRTATRSSSASASRRRRARACAAPCST